MKPLKADNAKQNRQSKKHKKGAYIMENTNKASEKFNNHASLERNELHNTIWKVANELRGSVDGWDFKQYVLGILFYRYISENMANHHNEYERKLDPSFDYASLSDEEAEIVRKFNH